MSCGDGLAGMESGCGGGSCGSDPFDRDDFEPIAPLLECATCRGEGAGLPGVEAIYCISLKEQPNRAKAAAGLFHALGLCRHVTMYRPHRGRHMPRAIWTSHRAGACHARQQGFRRVAFFEDDVMIRSAAQACAAALPMPCVACLRRLGDFTSVTLRCRPIRCRLIRCGPDREVLTLISPTRRCSAGSPARCPWMRACRCPLGHFDRCRHGKSSAYVCYVPDGRDTAIPGRP